MNKLTIPKWVVDEADEKIFENIWCDPLEFYHKVISSGEFNGWLTRDEDNVDVLMAYLNPLTQNLVEVIE